MSDSIVKCPSCGKSNRVPSLAPGKTALCGNCKALIARGGGTPVEVSEATLDGLLESNERVVVDFWAPWCYPCRMIAPSIEALASEKSDVVFAKMNVDDNPDMWRRFQISGIPLLVLFRNGKESGRVLGAQSKAKIEQAIGTYLFG